MRKLFASLTFYNYRLWFIGALVANIGTWMQRIGQDWLVMGELTHSSGFAAGIVTALQFAPALFLSPMAGVLADRLNRRKLLICTQSAQGVLAFALGAIVLSGQIQLWHVYAFALLLGMVTAIDTPVRQTFVAEMVPTGNLANAVGLNSASFNAARMIGPGVAGILIGIIGTGSLFIINGVSFVATIASLTLMRTAELHEMPHATREKGQIRQGLRYVRHRSDLIIILIVVSIVSCFGLNSQLTSGMMSIQVFGKGAGQYGMVSSIMAVGSIAGALLAARRERPRVRLVIGAAIAFGITSAISALMPTYLSFAFSGIAVGLSALTLITAANATMQLSTAPEYRGRVMAIYFMLFQGATPIGSPLIGWISNAFGARWSIGVGSIAALVVGISAAIWAMRSWHVRIRYQRRIRPHLQIVHPPVAESVPAAGSITKAAA